MLAILLIIMFISLFFLIKIIKIPKNYLISILISLFIIIFIFNLQVSINAVISGAKLCFYSILPTIFPFSVICNLLIYYDGISLYSKLIGPILCKPLKLSKVCSFSLIASIICGYPLGAKYSSYLYENKYISRKEYTRLINIATNCGPLFILGAVSVSLLKNSKYGIILLISNYFSLLIIGLLTIKNSDINNSNINNIPNNFQNNSFGDNFKNAISNALNTTFSVCGFILIFSVIINILQNSSYLNTFISSLENLLNIPSNLLSSILLGSVEITKGCEIVSKFQFSIHLKLAIISFLCSFSGLSIIFQCFSFIGKYNISIIKYSSKKLLQGIISFIITYFTSFFFNKTILASNIITKNNFNYNKIYFFIILLIIIPVLYKNLIKKSFFHNL